MIMMQQLTYREVMPWIVGTNNNDMMQLMKVCMVGMLDDGFNADYDKLVLIDGYFVGMSYNALVAQIRADFIVGFGSSHVNNIVAAMKAGFSPLEAIKIMKSGLVNILESKTINSTCMNLLRALCKQIILEEYNKANDME